MQDRDQRASGTVCRVHFNSGNATVGQVADCAACQEARAQEGIRRMAEAKRDSIDPEQPYMGHILFTCRNHPHLRWSRKNTHQQRSIFFFGVDDPNGVAGTSTFPRSGPYANQSIQECPCPPSDLVVLRKYLLEVTV